MIGSHAGNAEWAECSRILNFDGRQDRFTIAFAVSKTLLKSESTWTKTRSEPEWCPGRGIGRIVENWYEPSDGGSEVHDGLTGVRSKTRGSNPARITS